jgi:hypothetical protein
LNTCMMLTRRKPKGSNVKTHLVTVLSLLILACEIGYLDSLAVRETHGHLAGISQELVSDIVPTASEPSIIEGIELQTPRPKRFVSTDATAITPLLLAKRQDDEFCDQNEFRQHSKRR